MLTEWDSVLFGVAVHLRTITRDGWVCTAYRPGHSHDGTEGELYELADDPLQRVNRWADPACATTPVPSAVTDNPVDHVICFTREVPSVRAC